MLKALDEAAIRPDVIVGTSIGAFNGAVYAADPGPAAIERLAKLWADVAEGDLLGTGLVDRLKVLLKLRVAIHDTATLRGLLSDALPVGSIDDLEVPFQCVAASVERAAEHWFDAGPLVDALLASAAVPGLFPPVVIDGQHFYDGGLVNSVPVDRAVTLGATEIYVLQVGRLEQPLRPPTRLYETALVAFEIARRHRFGSMRDRSIPGIEMHILPSANNLRFDDPRQIRWSDLDDTTSLVASAYEASSEYLAGLSARR